MSNRNNMEANCCMVGAKWLRLAQTIIIMKLAIKCMPHHNMPVSIQQRPRPAGYVLAWSYAYIEYRLENLGDHVDASTAVHDSRYITGMEGGQIHRLDTYTMDYTFHGHIYNPASSLQKGSSFQYLGGSGWVNSGHIHHGHQCQTLRKPNTYVMCLWFS